MRSRRLLIKLVIMMQERPIEPMKRSTSSGRIARVVTTTAVTAAALRTLLGHFNHRTMRDPGRSSIVPRCAYPPVNRRSDCVASNTYSCRKLLNGSIQIGL